MTPEEIEALLKRAGLDQRQAAAALGVHRNTVGNWCRDGIDKPRDIFALKHLEQVMSITIESINNTDTITTTTTVLRAHGWEMPDDVAARDIVRFVGTDAGWRWQIQAEGDDWQTLADDIDIDDVAELAEAGGHPIATVEDVVDLFDGWNGADNHVDGFVAWAWEVREETAGQLRDDDLGDVIYEVAYSLNAHRQSRIGKERPDEAPPFWGHEPAAHAYLGEHRDDLIKALAQSLKDEEE